MALGGIPEFREKLLPVFRRETISCSTDVFASHYAPPLPSDDAVDVAINLLISKGKLVRDLSRPHESTYQWTVWSSAPSVLAKSAANERTIFTGVHDICKLLETLSFGGRTATLTYVNGPFIATESEMAGSSHEVDGIMRLGEKGDSIPCTDQSKPRLPTADVAVATEYKNQKTDSIVLQNRKQLIGGARHILHNDPVRTHTYGLSIEDTQVTFWYWSYSHCAMSTTFDLLSDPKTLITMLISFLFGTKEQLGFSPNVTRVQVPPMPGKYCFVYKVGEKFYRTLGSIFEKHTLSFTGRGTRVWKVVEVKSPTELAPLGAAMILKDYWLDVNEKTERERYTEMIMDLDAVAAMFDQIPKDDPRFEGMAPETKEKLRTTFANHQHQEYFLEIIDDFRVVVSKPPPPAFEPENVLGFSDAAPKARAVKSAGKDASRSSMSATLDASRAVDSTGHVAEMPQPFPWVHNQKYHSVVLIKDVCDVLPKLRTFRQAVQVMLDCLFAIQLLMFARWIHRDISIGNFFGLLQSDSLRGKLGDYEFMKRTGVLNPGTLPLRDPKTGTPYFMAVEILRGKPLFEPIKTVRPPPALSAFFQVPESAAPRNVVRHEAIHDLESVFWIFLWFLTMRFQHEPSMKWARGIFPDHTGCTQMRYDIFTQSQTLYTSLMKELHTKLQPFALFVDISRETFIAAYHGRQVPSSATTPPPTDPAICEALRRMLEPAQLPTVPEGIEKEVRFVYDTPAQIIVRPVGRDSDSGVVHRSKRARFGSPFSSQSSATTAVSSSQTARRVAGPPKAEKK